jgi:hypothetical protein
MEIMVLDSEVISLGCFAHLYLEYNLELQVVVRGSETTQAPTGLLMAFRLLYEQPEGHETQLHT